jgi:hypothetical protein
VPPTRGEVGIGELGDGNESHKIDYTKLCV